MTYWQRTLNGDDKAVDVVLRILESLRRMFGIDAPTRVDARIEEYGDGGGTLIERMRARVAIEASQNIVDGSTNGHHPI